MFHHIHRRLIGLLLVTTAPLMPFGIATQPGTVALAQGARSQVAAQARVSPAQEGPYQVGLPLIVRGSPQRVSVFGAEISPNYGALNALRADEAGVSWARYNGFFWSSIEPVQGVRNWEGAAVAEAELRELTFRGTTPIAIVRSTPAWARKNPASVCGPIRADALDAFAKFVGELATRNPNVQYWEMWNEPDVATDLVDPDAPFGCWGDDADQYYGGGYYAEMLKRVYPVLKKANPQAKLVLGGLLLDCDPKHPPAGRDCKPARFLEGILKNGGADAFDMVSYHGYPLWTGNPNEEWDLKFDTWKARGGVVLGKLDFLREVMRDNNVSKPVLLTEAGLICYQENATCPTPQMREAQANYVIRLYTRAAANNLAGAIWFTLSGPGYRESGLLNGDQSPRPGFTTLKFLANLLQGAPYTEKLSTDQYEGYAFRKGNTTYRVYWTNNDQSVTIPLPNGTRAIYNKTGTSFAPSNNQAIVSFDPIIIESEQ